MIYSISWVFDYDYYYSAKSTSDRILAEMSENNEPMNKDIFSEKLEHNLREQTGIEVTMDPLAVWTTRGQLISNNRKYIRNAINEFFTIYGMENIYDRKIPIEYDTVGFYVAQKLFHSYYNQYF